jgi:hypothetical protein
MLDVYILMRSNGNVLLVSTSIKKINGVVCKNAILLKILYVQSLPELNSFGELPVRRVIATLMRLIGVETGRVEWLFYYFILGGCNYERYFIYIKCINFFSDWLFRV